MTTRPLRFDTWGTYVYVDVEGAPQGVEDTTRGVLREIELACSRFVTDSDLSRVNFAAGEWVECSRLLLETVEVALYAAAVTDGAVNPLMGRPLANLGYDRDFASIDHGGPVTVEVPSPNAWQSVEIDADRGAIKIPRGTCLDLGATAKAWASDHLCERLSGEFQTSVLVSLGGDVRAIPCGETRTWQVRITERPQGADASALDHNGHDVWIDGGGLATSTTQARRWHRGSIELHHLLDPTTSAPVEGPWRTVTATGPTCVAANVASTAALVLQDHAVAWLDQREVDARLVSASGDVHTVGRWPVEVLS